MVDRRRLLRSPTLGRHIQWKRSDVVYISKDSKASAVRAFGEGVGKSCGSNPHPLLSIQWIAYNRAADPRPLTKSEANYYGVYRPKD